MTAEQPTAAKPTIKAGRKVVWALPVEIPDSQVIVTPDIAKTRSMRGKVVSVGIDVDELQPGDEIVFTMYVATEIKVDGDTYLVLKGDDVLAVIE